MGHKDDNTSQSYISRTSGVDVQAIISGGAADQDLISDGAANQDLINFVASMQTSVDHGAPVQHGSACACAEASKLSPDTAVLLSLDAGDSYNPYGH
jgi:hypothetical protein